MQTKMMNEGWATFIHYTLMTDLYDSGDISEGAFLEFLTYHTAVANQRDYQDLNVYALGFNMFKDIRRICENPTEEDEKWFPDIANKDWLTVVKDIVANYRDESFILQFLSPKLIRDMGLFSIFMDSKSSNLTVSSVSSDDDVLSIRRDLSEQMNFEFFVPSIEVTSCDLAGSRDLELTFKVKNDTWLKHFETSKTLEYLEYLWGYDVMIDVIEENEDDD